MTAVARRWRQDQTDEGDIGLEIIPRPPQRRQASSGLGAVKFLLHDVLFFVSRFCLKWFGSSEVEKSVRFFIAHNEAVIKRLPQRPLDSSCVALSLSWNHLKNWKPPHERLTGNCSGLTYHGLANKSAEEFGRSWSEAGDLL
jgi:hypothetical protein